MTVVCSGLEGYGRPDAPGFVCAGVSGIQALVSLSRCLCDNNNSVARLRLCLDVSVSRRVACEGPGRLDGVEVSRLSGDFVEVSRLC